MSSQNIIRIATRQSSLAMWQAEYVQAALRRAHPELEVVLLPMTTRGDQLLDSPLAKIGGKGLFIKELEVAMLEGRADIAVHSMKDVPMAFPDELELRVICEREDFRDAFVSNEYGAFVDLPEGATVGSSSLRRQSQLKALRPDLTISDLRGNVNTRLSKLDRGDYDAIILAVAGLKRLGMEDRIRESLDTTVCLPSGGQGAVGIECRRDDTHIHELIDVLQHQPSAITVTAERSMNKRLNGGCQVPIACLAEFTAPDMKELWVRGLVAEVDGSRILRSEARGPASEAAVLGEQVADDLLAQGAGRILEALLGS